jgi:hypothetical protein
MQKDMEHKMLVPRSDYGKATRRALFLDGMIAMLSQV